MSDREVACYPRQLPVEIIRIVVSYVMPSESFSAVTSPREPRHSALLPLLLVNRTWSAFAHEHLYTHPRFESSDQLDRFCSSAAMTARVASVTLGSPILSTTEWHQYQDMRINVLSIQLQQLARVCPSLKTLYVIGRAFDLDLSPVIRKVWLVRL